MPILVVDSVGQTIRGAPHVAVHCGRLLLLHCKIRRGLVQELIRHVQFIIGHIKRCNETERERGRRGVLALRLTSSRQVGDAYGWGGTPH